MFMLLRADGVVEVCQRDFNALRFMLNFNGGKFEQVKETETCHLSNKPRIIKKQFFLLKFI